MSVPAAPAGRGTGRPRVTVLVPAYNHGAFVARALDSALMQRTDFPVEILVGDDASTDGTRGIVERYAAAHPGRIRAVLRDENIGGRRNFLDCLSRCRGEYVALLESDDFWLSPAKLASQVGLLDANPSAHLAAHEGFNEYPDGSRELYVGGGFGRVPGPVIGLAEVCFENFLPTCSLMFRRDAVREFPADVVDWPVLDWLLIVLLAMKGPVLYQAEPWSVRRVHPGGVMSMRPLSYKYRVRLQCIEIADRLTSRRFHREGRWWRAQGRRFLGRALMREHRPLAGSWHLVAGRLSSLLLKAEGVVGRS